MAPGLIFLERKSLGLAFSEVDLGETTQVFSHDSNPKTMRSGVHSLRELTTMGGPENSSSNFLLGLRSRELGPEVAVGKKILNSEEWL